MPVYGVPRRIPSPKRRRSRSFFPAAPPAGGGGGTVTLTAGTPTTDGVGGLSVNVALPSGLTAGDYTFLFCTLNSSSPGIQQPTGFTTALANSSSDIASGSASHHIAIFYRAWQPGDTDPVNVAASSTGRWAVVPVKVSGANTSNPLEGSVGVTKQTTSTASVDAPAVTPSAATTFVTVHSGRSSTSGVAITWTPPGSMTELADAAPTGSTTMPSIEVCHQTVATGSSTGTRTATASTPCTGSQGASLLFVAAAGGGTTSVTA